MASLALLAEGVDRNFRRLALCSSGVVALLAEGVDRNLQAEQSFRAEAQVALLAEGVDRNIGQPHSPQYSLRRPPRGGRG